MIDLICPLCGNHTMVRSLSWDAKDRPEAWCTHHHTLTRMEATPDAPAP